MGGGGLFLSLLDLGMVDTVETAIIPVVLGADIRLQPPFGKSSKPTLANHRVYAKTGTVLLECAVKSSTARTREPR